MSKVVVSEEIELIMYWYRRKESELCVEEIEERELVFHHTARGSGIVEVGGTQSCW